MPEPMKIITSQGELTVYQILAKNLANVGYGLHEDAIHSLLLRFTEEEIERLTYNMWRTAEKMGNDAFDCHVLWVDTL